MIETLSEVSEVKKNVSSDMANRNKAFENSRTDVGCSQHIKTINEGLAGKRHPETNVSFKRKEFIYDGHKVDGVFPSFESRFDTLLPKDLRSSSDTVQFKYCAKMLCDYIQKNPEMENSFTPRQIEQIKNGNPVISGLTWHHKEIPGKMQLVNSDVHNRTAHTGGKCVWGGGR